MVFIDQILAVIAFVRNDVFYDYFYDKCSFRNNCIT